MLALLVPSVWVWSENSEGAFFFLQYPAPMFIHPSKHAPPFVGHLVVDGRDAGRSQSVDVTQRALIMPRSFGISFWAKAGAAMVEEVMTSEVTTALIRGWYVSICF